MTATDSSHLEPDIDRSASPPVESANSIGDGSESASGPIKSAQPPAALLARDEPSNSAAAGPDDRPRATRVAEGAWLGGVCTGLARHLGWPVMAVRIAFVALATFQFIGVLAYGALWLLLPPESTVKAPGLESASRAGMRDHGRPKRRIDWGMLLALVALGVGLLLITQNTSLGISSKLFWPVAFACAGAALVWRQADSAQQKRWRDEAGGRAWLAPFVARGGWPALVRVIVGLGLVGAAFGIVIAQQGQIAQLPEVMAMTMLALAGPGDRPRTLAAPLTIGSQPGKS